ncbi:UNVERIFIED_CONTAM: hypothetical protein GTU68_056344 [Idotea baltica]|nr:hypothetical protein [Idotea baltica]
MELSSSSFFYTSPKKNNDKDCSDG